MYEHENEYGLSRGLMQAMSLGFDDYKTLFTNKIVKFENIILAEKNTFVVIFSFGF